MSRSGIDRAYRFGFENRKPQSAKIQRAIAKTYGGFAKTCKVVAEIEILVADFTNAMSFSVTKCALNSNLFVASFAIVAIL
jgi:hypothetical protein